MEFVIFLRTAFRTLLFGFRLLKRLNISRQITKVKSGDALTILANGPSLKNDIDDIDLTCGDFSVLNDFNLSPLYKKIKPSYYVLADPYYFLCNDSIMPFINGVDWKMKLIVPYSAWKKLEILRDLPNKNVEVIPFHTVEYDGFECFRNWIYKKGLAMPRVQNVLALSIFSAINLGYKKIKLYGVDHSWTECIRVNSLNEVCQINAHFFDTAEVELSPWKKCSGEQYKMHEILRDLSNMFESYHLLKRYSDYMGSKIINCTKDSFIDAFERNENC